MFWTHLSLPPPKELEPICPREVTNPFFSKEVGESLVKSLSSQGVASPQGNLLEEVAQELHLFFHPFVEEKDNLKKRIKTWTFQLKGGDSSHCTTMFTFKMILQEIQLKCSSQFGYNHQKNSEFFFFLCTVLQLCQA